MASESRKLASEAARTGSAAREAAIAAIWNAPGAGGERLRGASPLVQAAPPIALQVERDMGIAELLQRPGHA